MVAKLAFVRVHNAANEPPDKLLRDEILLVIADTTIVTAAEDPAALLEQWRAAG